MSTEPHPDNPKIARRKESPKASGQQSKKPNTKKSKRKSTPKSGPTGQHRIAKVESVRLAAVRALLEFDSGGLLRDEPPPSLKKIEDRRLYLQLVRGVLRHKRLLESTLEQLTKKPLRKLDRELLYAALLGLFQLRFLERIPSHAAVFETVALAAPLGLGYGKGWLNAILRRALRESDQETKSHGATEDLPLAVRTSFPDWMVERWQRHYGQHETEQICKSANLPGGLTLRVETGRVSVGDLAQHLSNEGVTTQPHPMLTSALWTDQTGELLRTRAFAEGLCYAQDVSSQILMSWCRPLFKGRVVDVCSAPGGKLTLAVGWREPNLQLIGMEPSHGRLVKVRENLQRLRLPAVPLIQADGTLMPFQETGLADGMLLDVPCTATGIIRKYPEIKWRRSPEDPARQATLQQTLLQRAADGIKPGGWLLYMTCSLEPEENEQNIERFLESRQDYARQSFRDLSPPEGLAKPPQELITTQEDFLCLPGKFNTGLYAALLRQKNEPSEQV